MTKLKIRMLEAIGGTFHGYENVKRGDVVEVDDDNGMRYCSLGYAEPYSKSAVPVETATEPVEEVETTVAVNGIPAPLDEEPEAEPESEPEAVEPSEAAKARVAAKRPTRRR